MKKICCHFGVLKSTAKIVDGKWILSFPGALKPTVWQMDFEQFEASALEVDEKGDQFSLILKTPQGKGMDIAHFESKAKAVQALVAASKALEGGQGKIRPMAAHGAGGEVGYSEARPKRKWTAPLLGLLLLFVLFIVWVALAPRPPGSLGQQNSSFGGAPASVSGVPMSADDFLRAQ